MEELTEEIDYTEYEHAATLADNILVHANAIRNVFDDIDGLMRMLHGNHWGSSGSENVNAQYIANVKSQFEPFYEDVVKMKTHIYEVTGHNMVADNRAEANITSV